MTITSIDHSSLIQRRGNAELPANGHWVLHPTSFVGLSNVYDRLQLPVSHGMLSIAEPPRPSSLTIVAAPDDRWIRLTAIDRRHPSRRPRFLDVAADRHPRRRHHPPRRRRHHELSRRPPSL